MKRYLFAHFCIVLGLFLLSACNTEPQKNPDVNADGSPKTPEKVLDQIPAAEILGSTVTRHLRFQSQAELETVLPDPDQLLNYIGGVSGSFRKEIGKIRMEEKQRGHVFVAMKANGESKLWYLFQDRQPSAALKEALKKGVKAVQPLEMKQGLVVFGVALSLWGYIETDREENEVVIPAEWTAAGKKLGGDHPASELALAAWEQGD